MAASLALHPDRLLPAEPGTRAIARRLYSEVRRLPIVSPHGHTDPAWFAGNEPFADPAQLLITPDHYLLRMLYSQGIALERLGVARSDGTPREADSRSVWRLFAANYHLFRGTPSRLWLDWVFAAVFGLDVRLQAETADHYFDAISGKLAEAAFRPRALFEQFGIEVLATTESPLDDLRHHEETRRSGWPGRLITTFRPDPVLDPEFEGFRGNLARLSDITGCDAFGYQGYLDALRARRRYFAAMGATATDHGHPTAATASLGDREARALFRRVVAGAITARDAELFRAHMLTVMAGMSLEDGLVMQLHPGSHRNHNAELFARFGRDKGAGSIAAISPNSWQSTSSTRTRRLKSPSTSPTGSASEPIGCERDAPASGEPCAPVPGRAPAPLPARGPRRGHRPSRAGGFPSRAPGQSF